MQGLPSFAQTHRKMQLKRANIESRSDEYQLVFAYKLLLLTHTDIFLSFICLVKQFVLCRTQGFTGPEHTHTHKHTHTQHTHTAAYVKRITTYVSQSFCLYQCRISDARLARPIVDVSTGVSFQQCRAFQNRG